MLKPFYKRAVCHQTGIARNSSAIKQGSIASEEVCVDDQEEVPCLACPCPQHTLIPAIKMERSNDKEWNNSIFPASRWETIQAQTFDLLCLGMGQVWVKLCWCRSWLVRTWVFCGHSSQTSITINIPQFDQNFEMGPGFKRVLLTLQY